MPAWSQELSHHDLLGLPTIGAGQPQAGARTLSAIVVPTHRAAAQLEVASQLAIDTHAVLLLLTNTRAEAREAHFLLRARFPMQKLFVVAVPPRVTRLDQLMRSWESSVARLKPYGRVAAKRNLALVIAASMGWGSVLFLDDDVGGLDAECVTGAVDQLSDRCRAVGWTVSKFPDNSVVCHARRELGDRQEVFLGAGALLVSTTRDRYRPFDGLPPFPHTYNEDWLFLFDLLAQKAVIRMPDHPATQDEYDPFQWPARARREEAGDVLAEGLFSLLHQAEGFDPTSSGSAMWRLLAPARDAARWSAVIDGRARLIDELIRRAANGKHPRGADIAASLRQAQLGLSKLSAHRLAGFVTEWRRDVEAWTHFLARVPRSDDLDVTLAWMGVPASLTSQK